MVQDGSKNFPSPSPNSCTINDASRQVSTDKVERGVGKSAVQSTGTPAPRRRVARTLWRCDRCPYVTAKRSQHETHRQLHGSRQRHTCRLCDYSVGGLHLLMQHVRLHHRQETTADVRKTSSGCIAMRSIRCGLLIAL